MKIAIVAEKATLLRLCLPEIARRHRPDGPVAALCAHPYRNLAQRFAYPRGLRLRDYPLAKAPSYKPVDLESGSVQWLAGEARPDGPEAATWEIDAGAGAKALRDADKVIAIPDWDPSGCLLATQVLDQVLPLGHADPRVAFLLLDSPEPSGIRRALDSVGHAAGAAAAMAAAGRAKQRLDYNYAMNANVILRPIQERAGSPKESPPLSKYGLQLLYALRGMRPASEGEMIDLMKGWRGSGRYAAAGGPGLGSPASRHSIIESLQAAGLCLQAGQEIRLGRDGRPSTTRVLLGISDAGLRLLDALHPDCEDPDLPFRIRSWQDLPEGEAAVRADRYVRTFFGKMARFAGEDATS